MVSRKAVVVLVIDGVVSVCVCSEAKRGGGEKEKGQWTEAPAAADTKTKKAKKVKKTKKTKK